MYFLIWKKYISLSIGLLNSYLEVKNFLIKLEFYIDKIWFVFVVFKLFFVKNFFLRMILVVNNGNLMIFCILEVVLVLMISWLKNGGKFSFLIIDGN